MKKELFFLLTFVLLYSCTSNTIFEKPKDLIPKDTMQMLLQEMVIASSAKYIKTKNQQKNINYMPFVYEKYKIDSTRFNSSNFYYMSKIDLYQEILEASKNSLEKRNKVFKREKLVLDSIRKDSVDKARVEIKRLDSLKRIQILDSLKRIKK
ncbi:DUF4296 domain-containing protein [Polaribacter tangerinus]|uniref:DUF4296 domain-containing protein n=1 Tax=Polaribacter tangerinus TaxID=1920034 RepID=UPI000B4AFE37|nr:DUF4296 domain-containing protein [Polaribacter tangerinus]